MKNLCGHHVGRWTVHRPPPIPNSAEPSRDALAVGAVLAIEPFSTEGLGFVIEQGPAEVFRLLPGPRPAVEGALAEALEEKHGLPFSRRDLSAFPRAQVDRALETLLRQGRVAAYPPLVEASGRKVAQAEHTLYVGAGGVEVLTR
jgi:methionyl aminopeptidase